MIEGTGSTNVVFDVMAIFLSINIIFWFTWSTYYYLKYIFLLRKKKEIVFFLTYINLTIGILFAIIFWYIILATTIRGNIIDNSSFGAIAIRPVILMQAVTTAIGALEKYRKERK